MEFPSTRAFVRMRIRFHTQRSDSEPHRGENHDRPCDGINKRQRQFHPGPVAQMIERSVEVEVTRLAVNGSNAFVKRAAYRFEHLIDSLPNRNKRVRPASA